MQAEVELESTIPIKFKVNLNKIIRLKASRALLELNIEKIDNQILYCIQTRLYFKKELTLYKMNQECDFTTSAEVNNNLTTVNDDTNYHAIECKKGTQAKLTLTNIPNDYEILGLEDTFSLIMKFSKNNLQDLCHQNSSNLSRSNTFEEESNTRLSSPDPSLVAVTSHKSRTQVQPDSPTLTSTSSNELEEESQTRLPSPTYQYVDVPFSISNTRLDSALPLATPPTANMLFFKKNKVPRYSISSTCYSPNELEEESNTILSSPNPSLNVVTSNEIRIQVLHHSNSLQSTRQNEVEEEGNTRSSSYNSNYTDITSTKTEMKLHREIVNTKQKYYSLFSKVKRYKIDLNHNDNRVKMNTNCKKFDLHICWIIFSFNLILVFLTEIINVKGSKLRSINFELII